ncbi:DUF2809 domain-containing protein [Bradyrhizobium sp. Rc2d]|uniref:ribosomal maturation YjgA family protein n=1 Tax=Bradyrhizobium sp. Rc2d TaxID=1855321 RepID=UPI001FCCEF0C|nr:DUF2809 domain-containing protein [Bradyrhizobium sp. Rc2d]
MHGAQPDKPVALLRTSLIRAALALGVIVSGLSLRWYGFPLGLPAFVVKYGGSLLWATMVFLLVGVLLPRLTRTQIAVMIAIVVEFSRLVHTPWLDAFRSHRVRKGALAPCPPSASPTTMMGTLRFVHPTKPTPWRAVFTPRVETARSDRARPRSCA